MKKMIIYGLLLILAVSIVAACGYGNLQKFGCIESCQEPVNIKFIIAPCMNQGAIQNNTRLAIQVSANSCQRIAQAKTLGGCEFDVYGSGIGPNEIYDYYDNPSLSSQYSFVCQNSLITCPICQGHMSCVWEAIPAYCDNTSVKVVLYSGTTMEVVQDWVDNVSFAPTIIDSDTNSSWKLDTGNFNTPYSLVIYARKAGNVSSVTSRTINFTLAETGVVFGQCYQYANNGSAYYGPDTDAFNNLFGSIGGGWTTTVLWILVILVITAIIWFTGAGNPMVMGIIGIVDMFLLIIGAYLHLISWIPVGIIFIILIIVAVTKIKDAFS